MNLLVIESPGKRRVLASILGPQWRIESTGGHLRELPAHGLQVGEAPDYAPRYEVRSDKRAVLERLKRWAQGSAVFIATDPDREGEAIAWHVAELIGRPDARRVHLPELTPAAVSAGIAAAGVIDKNLVRAQEARRIIDRLIGYGLTGALTRRIGETSPAGRVPTPAVRLVVERDRTIEKFNPCESLGVRLWGSSGAWHLDFAPDASALEGLGGYDDRVRLIDRARADRLAATQLVSVAVSEEADEGAEPPPPFKTSTLLRAASVELQLAPERTMSIARALYEAGFITYFRTDSENMGNGTLEAVRGAGEAKRLPMERDGRRFAPSAFSQNAHPAIVPTDPARENAGESAEARSLYSLIWRRTVASQMEAAKFRVRSLQAIGEDLGRRATFGAMRRELIAPGWLLLLGARSEGEHGAPDLRPAFNELPRLSLGAAIRITRGEVLVHRQNPPERFTESSLIAALEAEGIGRPSTFAGIVRHVRDEGYAELRDGNLRATDRGRQLVDLVSGRFVCTELQYTSRVEAALDRVASGALEYSAAVASVDAVLQGELASFELECPACKQGFLAHRIFDDARTGERRESWECTRWHDGCEGWFADRNGLPNFDLPIRRRVVRECPACSEKLLHLMPAGISRGGRRYEAFWVCRATGCGKTFPDRQGQAVMSGIDESPPAQTRRQA